MAYCKNCGQAYTHGSKFCASCGSQLQYSEQKTTAVPTSLDVNIMMQVVLKGNAAESTNVEVRLAHLNKTVSMSIPNNVSVGQIFRLRKMGYVSHDGQKGDTYVHITAIHHEQEKETREEPYRKINYEGEIRKCPNCGDIIDAYETVCDTCGYEIRGRKSTSVVHELSIMLGQTIDTERKDELIRNFYIPNTREDIHEFFILALSNIKNSEANTKAWMVKLEQAYQKAELAFNGTQELERLRNLYEQAQRINKKNGRHHFLMAVGRIFKSGYAWAVLIALIGLLFELINISLDIETLSIIGFGAFAVAGWIALMTMIHNEDKKGK